MYPNGGNTQPAQVPGQTKRPEPKSLPYTETNDEVDFGDGDFEFVDGKLTFKTPDNQQVEDQQSADTSTPSDSVKVQPADLKTEVKDSKTEASSEVESLRSQLNQLTQIVLNFVKGGAGSSQQEQQQQEEVDFNDGSSIAAYIKKSIAEGVQAAMAPYNQNMQAVDMQLKFNNLRAKHGAEFDSLIPQMGEILKVDPDIPFDKAFAMAKAIVGVKGNPTKTQDGNTKETPNLKPALSLIKKSNDLKTESGDGIQAQTRKREVHSVRDALELALEQMAG